MNNILKKNIACIYLFLINCFFKIMIFSIEMEDKNNAFNQKIVLKDPVFIDYLIENYKSLNSVDEKIMLLKNLSFFLNEKKVFEFFIQILNYPIDFKIAIQKNDFLFQVLQILNENFLKISENDLEKKFVLFSNFLKNDNFVDIHHYQFIKLLFNISENIFKKNNLKSKFYFEKSEYLLYDQLESIDWNLLENEWILFQYIALYLEKKLFLIHDFLPLILKEKINIHRNISVQLRKHINKLLRKN